MKQLDSPNGVFRWNAARTLACLAAADTENQIEPLLDKYLSVIPGPRMIDAANVIGSAWKIARAKPRLADRIARAILGVSQAQYQTEECRKVAAGHALQSLGRFFDLIEDQPAVVAFARAQLGSAQAIHPPEGGGVPQEAFGRGGRGLTGRARRRGEIQKRGWKRFPPVFLLISPSFLNFSASPRLRVKPRQERARQERTRQRVPPLRRYVRLRVPYRKPNFEVLACISRRSTISS